MQNQPVTPDSHIPIQRACYSHPGKQRERNEDACALPSPRAEVARRGVLLALADGVGGMSGGQEASLEAVANLQALYYADVGSNDPSERLQNCFSAVNHLNRRSRRPANGQPAYLTTLVAAVLQDENIWIANVGDSRAYLAPAGDTSLRQLTEDHSGETRNQKAVHAGEPVRQDRPGLITRAIGLEENPQVDLYRYTWKPGDRIILSSDGLSGLPVEEMFQLVFDGVVQQAVRSLVERAVQLDGSDNCTAVVAEYQPPEAAETAGSAIRSANATHPTIHSAPPANLSVSEERADTEVLSEPDQTAKHAETEWNTTSTGKTGFDLDILEAMDRSRRMSIWLALLVGALIGGISAALFILYWLGYL